jgi:dipeptidyl-peptidase-4
MKRRFVALVGLAFGCGGASVVPSHPMPSPAPSASSSAPLTRTAPHVDREWIRAYAATHGFRYGSPQGLTPTPDGKAILFLRSKARDTHQALYETDLANGATREVLTADTLLAGPETLSAAEKARRERQRVTARGLASFELSEDGARVLVPLSGRLFVLDRATGKTHEIKGAGAGILDPRFSPDGSRVAYVRDSDVHVVDVEGAGHETAVTHGGTELKPHGLAEFVAQEELARARGYWFSPDGAKLAFEEADSTKVEQLSIVDVAHPEKTPYRSPYPRAGKDNATVRLGIASSHGGGAPMWVAWDNARFPYLVSVTWMPGAPLTIYVLDRLQQHGQLLAVDDATGNVTMLLEERDDAWLNHDTTVPNWLAGGKSFLWASDRSGTPRLELRDAKGALVRGLTPPELVHGALLGIDEARGVVFAEASPEPTDASIYEIALDGTGAKRIAGAQGESVTGRFSHGQKNVFATVRTTRDAMPHFEARWVADATKSVAIPSVVEAPGAIPKIEFAEVGDDHYRVAIIRPRSFDPSRTYPIIDAAYGGPGYRVVTSSASTFLLHQWIADATDAVVVAIDARGTPGRGRVWERALYGKMGSVPIEGHVAAIQALGATRPELDVTRVGVYGWSFGGYFAALASIVRPDVYSVAVAGAPVTDWRNYDTCYTERFLGLPSPDPAAYDAASVVVAARKKTESPRPLLLIHGTDDDNVYFLHSLELADALERSHRPFELMPISGSTHMLAEPDMSEAVWSRAAAFLRDGLARAK